jgi:hypothetical protein
MYAPFATGEIRWEGERTATSPETGLHVANVSPRFAFSGAGSAGAVISSLRVGLPKRGELISFSHPKPLLIFRCAGMHSGLELF